MGDNYDACLFGSIIKLLSFFIGGKRMIEKILSRRKELKAKTKLLKNIGKELNNIHYSMEEQKEHIEHFMLYISELKELTDKTEFDAIMYDINAEMEQLGVFIKFDSKDKNRDYSPEIA